ncbi:mucoidy inhibitor MuiA family protein, partial [candidate division WOR-3 bacterium]|nr:mucoidy inhibitor MuiA family protein [candidate division WOR-3 bacterium]
MIALLLAVQAVTVSSQIDSVMVYPYQVLVVRSATVTVPGSGELAFPGLPGGLDDNSVRIRARGLRIGEVQVRRGYLAEPTPEVRRLEARLKELEDQLKGLDDEAAVLKAKEDFLNSVRLGSPEIIARELQQGRVAPESWRGALSFIGDELVRVKARAVKLAREKDELGRKVEAARQEYTDAKAAIENRKEVGFDYAAEPGTYPVQLSYVIHGAAAWTPYYELRARPDVGQVEVSYFAKLTQRTGENWSGVRVVLSTMRPTAGDVAPEPRPWYLSLFEPMQTRRRVMAEAAPMMAPGGYDGVMMEKAEVGDQIQPVETGISLQYAIPGRVSLASGEPAKKLSLHQVSLPAEFEYYALPKAREQAFLTGQIANASAFVFLAGSGNTYVGEEYTGSTDVPAVAPQESVQVTFGVDERVKVKRELVKSFKSKGGLFSKTEKASFVYKTTVENYLSKSVTVRVVEQVPVSQQ